MNIAEDKDDFADAATLPRTVSRHFAVSVMCRRIDALCGPRGDEEIAARYGVEQDVVRALRHDIGRLDPEHGDSFRLIVGLAVETGVRADWILGLTDDLGHGPRIPEYPRNSSPLKLGDRIKLFSLLGISIVLHIITILLSL